MKTDSEALWASKADEEVNEALAELGSFSDEAAAVILAEANRRALSSSRVQSVPREAEVIPRWNRERPSGCLHYLAISLAFLAFAIYFFSKDSRSLFEKPDTLLLIFGLAGAAYLSRKWHGWKVQEYLNRIADTIPITPTAAPYWLYLRPFHLDGALPVENPAWGLLGLFGFVNRYREFEELLREAVGRKGHLALVGLGARANHVGAGRVETADSAWQEIFEKLAQSARCILVIPAHGSVRWEVEFLLTHGMLERTVFVMPPTPRHTPMLKRHIRSSLSKRDLRSSFKSVLDVIPETEGTQERWDEATREMHSLGLEVPEYRRGGMLFTFDESGSPKDQAVLKTHNPRVLRKGLKWLTSDPLV